MRSCGRRCPRVHRGRGAPPNRALMPASELGPCSGTFSPPAPARPRVPSLWSLGRVPPHRLPGPASAAHRGRWMSESKGAAGRRGGVGADQARALGPPVSSRGRARPAGGTGRGLTGTSAAPAIPNVPTLRHWARGPGEGCCGHIRAPEKQGRADSSSAGKSGRGEGHPLPCPPWRLGAARAGSRWDGGGQRRGLPPCPG